MIYLIIGLSVYAITVTVFLIFFEGSKRDEEKELELRFMYYACLEQVRLEKVDAEIAYLETQYGLDNYVRERKTE